LKLPFHITCNNSLDVIIIDDDSPNNVGDTLKNPPAKVEQASKCIGKEEAVCTKQAQGHASSTEVIILDEENESHETFGMKTSFNPFLFMFLCFLMSNKFNFSSWLRSKYNNKES
jgi:hypothetical protein